MAKLLWTLFAATMGFVVAVAATPGDEDSVRRAFERGYAEGTKNQQTDAVRRGYAVWLPSDAEGTPTAFRWSSQTPSPHRRGGRPDFHQNPAGEPAQSARQHKDRGGREHDAG